MAGARFYNGETENPRNWFYRDGKIFEIFETFAHQNREVRKSLNTCKIVRDRRPYDLYRHKRVRKRPIERN